MTDTVNETNQASAFDELVESLAGVKLSDVAAVRFESLPPMKGDFEISEIKVRSGETKNGDTYFIDVKCTCIDPLVAIGDAYQTKEGLAKLTGKTHNETFFVVKEDATTGLGRLRAWLEDSGFAQSEIGFSEMLKGGIVGHKFAGQIKHRVNKDDKDRPYANLIPLKTTATMLNLKV